MLGCSMTHLQRTSEVMIYVSALTMNLFRELHLPFACFSMGLAQISALCDASRRLIPGDFFSRLDLPLVQETLL